MENPSQTCGVYTFKDLVAFVDDEHPQERMEEIKAHFLTCNACSEVREEIEDVLNLTKEHLSSPEGAQCLHHMLHEHSHQGKQCDCGCPCCGS